MSTNDAKQTFEAWDIGLPRAAEVSVDALIDDWEGFRILLRNHLTNGVVRIAFDTQLAYQSRDESDFIGEAVRSEGFGRGDIYATLYRVWNWEFVARYLRDSLKGHSGSELTHFAIVTGAQCIDIIATSEPRVEDLTDLARERAAIEMQRRQPR